MIYRSIVIFLFVFTVLTSVVDGTVYRIGADRETKSLKSIASRLEPGDTVEIDPGTYREALKLTANGTKDSPITIRGTGDSRPLFDGEGVNVSGRGSIPRAIIQVEGEHLIVEHLEFKNARNGNNGAGIRLNGSRNAVIRDCKITYCDMGIQGGDRETVTIESCDVGFNGTPEYSGYSHNFYLTGNWAVVRNCYIHDSLYGQNFKSRAHYNELWYNWIVDSNEGEVGPVDGKGATDRPHSNVLMVGNVIISKPDRTGNKAKYVLFGSELGGSHQGTLYMFHNILIARSPRNIFVQLDDPQAGAVISRNIFYGSDHILAFAEKPVSVTGKQNWVPKTADIPEEFRQTLTGVRPGFVSIAERNFRLKPDSPVADLPSSDLYYVDGDGVTRDLSVDDKRLRKVRVWSERMSEVSEYGIHDTKDANK